MRQHTHTPSPGGIRRGPRQADHFTILSNAVLNDERLSFRARGILIWLLSKPADWRTRSEAIAAQSPKEGREAIRTAMRELEQLGYLVREKVQNERGQWSTIQTVYEVPVTDPQPEPEKPRRGPADNGDPDAHTKDRSLRTETNNNVTRNDRPSRPEPVESVSSSKIDELEAATTAAGLPASYRRIRPEQHAEIERLLELHGVDALAAAALAAHRPTNPTMHVHGWLRLWQAIPAPRRTVTAPKCTTCEGTGYVISDDDLAVRCACRTAAAA